MSKFVVRIGRDLFKYDNLEDVPDAFDHLIEANFDYPPEPHSKEDHERLSKYNGQLQELMRREKACRLLRG